MGVLYSYNNAQPHIKSTHLKEIIIICKICKHATTNYACYENRILLPGKITRAKDSYIRNFEIYFGSF